MFAWTYLSAGDDAVYSRDAAAAAAVGDVRHVIGVGLAASGVQTKSPMTKPPSGNRTPFRVNNLCFTVNIVTEKDRSVHGAFNLHYTT